MTIPPGVYHCVDMRKAEAIYGSSEEVADELGIPVGTVYAWRYRGVGPKGLKVGRHVRYRWSDVEAWLESNAKGGPNAA